MPFSPRGESGMKFEYFRAGWQTSIEEAKRQYHKLVFENHPDYGGSDEAMVQINREWDYLRKHNFNLHETKEGSVYTDESQDVPDEVTERFAEIIASLVHMEGVGIEICGSFVWLSGNTYEWRQEIRELGFKWARRKKRWFLAPKNYRKRGSEWSMDKIRSHHGSYVVVQGFVPQQRLLNAAAEA